MLALLSHAPAVESLDCSTARSPCCAGSALTSNVRGRAGQAGRQSLRAKQQAEQNAPGVLRPPG